MPCPQGASPTTTGRAKRAALGDRTFHCHASRRRFNGRTGTPFNYLEYPADLVLRW